VTFTTIGSPSGPEAVGETLTMGGLSTLPTVITVLEEPLSALLAVNVTVWLPDWVKSGVHVRVPLVFPAPGVNVAPAGRLEAESVVRPSPSGSDAVTSTVISEFSAPEAVGGALTTGAWSKLVTVMSVLFDPVSALLAVNVTV
jgi:hypothetical protein